MSPKVRRAHHQLTFLVLAVGVGTFSLLQSLVSPVLALLQHSLHTTQSTVTWVLTAYLLSASVCTPILGRIGDMVGKKKVLVVVLATLAAGSILAALATSIAVMIVARAIQGVGGGLIPLAFGIVRDEFPRDKVAGAVGAIAALLAVGGGLGLVLAGPIVDALDYHWLFWIPGAAMVVAAVATWFVVPESPVRTPGRISWLGAVLLSAWLVGLLVAVSEAPDWGWGSGWVIGLLVVSVLLAAAWMVIELRSAEPLIDMRMMRIPAVWATNLVGFLFGVGMYSLFAFLPEFLQTPSAAGYGFSASITESGLILLPMSASMFVFGVYSSRLARWSSAKTVLVAGSAVSVLPMLILAFAHGHIWEIAVATFLLGAGFGLAFSAMSSIIVDSVPSSQTGVASGMNANIRTIGGSVGAAVMASVVTSELLPDGLPTESSYTTAFAMLAGALLLAAFAGLLIPRLPGARDAHQQEQAEMSHPELAIVAGGTLVGNDPE
ncbi:MAG: MFS transporter [Actinobacteria bacterium]|nr:MFS transporter [Actinomycetota bacterium]